MKNKLHLLLAGFAAASLLFSSCSITNNQFSKQRYTNFGTDHNSLTQGSKTSLKVKQADPVNSLVSVPPQQSGDVFSTSITVEPGNHSVPVRTGGEVHAAPHELTSGQVNELKKIAARSPQQKITSFKEASHPKRSRINQVALVIICILLPPLAVFLVKDLGVEFWLDLLLTLLFWIPGLIYALIVCLG